MNMKGSEQTRDRKGADSFRGSEYQETRMQDTSNQDIRKN